MSSRIVTVFSEQKIAQAGSPSMIASVVAHFLTVAILFVLVKLGVPHVVNVPPQELSMVRVLTYNPPNEDAQAGNDGLRYQSHHAPAKKAAGGTLRPQQRLLPSHPKMKTGPQTLLQAHPNKTPPPEHAIIPTVLLTAAHPKITEKIFTSVPHRNPAAPKPTMLTLPNAETHVADILLSSAHFTTTHLVLPPSTTVPYQLRNPTVNAQIVETTSPSQHPPTPTRLFALSDLSAMKGMIAIPQSQNEIQKTAVKGSAIAGLKTLTPSSGVMTRMGLSMLPSNLPDPGTTGKQASADPNAFALSRIHGSSSRSNSKNTSLTANNGLSTLSGTSNAQSPSSNRLGNHISFTHLSRPSTGQFGAVLMGDSPEQDFPETADLWTGRNAYTVYINVGTPTSWILQYSLPKAATPAQLRGTLSAPFPYDMLRPNFASSELNADDLLIHGFINTEGKLVDLTVEFPPGFSLAQRILKALAQWQFRPATLNGAAARVEILLIIPNPPN